MLEVPATEVAKRFSRYRQAAQHEPVAVTHHGRATEVLMSKRDYDEYLRLKAMETRTLWAHELSDEAIAALRKARVDPVSPEFMSRITFDSNLCGGRPCIRGYRLRVADVLDMLASGATAEEIRADYEFLEAEDIRACLQYASEQLDHPVLIGAA